jgi:hypothetical protein
VLSSGGKSWGRSGLRKSPFGPLPTGWETLVNPSDGLPDNLDGIRAKMRWGFEKDRENLQKDAERIWGKMMQEEDVKSNEDGRGDSSKEN